MNRRGSTLTELLVIIVLIGTVGAVTFALVLEFTKASLRTDQYQTRTNSVESVFGFTSAQLNQVETNKLGLGAWAAPPPSYAAEVLKDNPRAYYPLDGSTATVANAATSQPPFGAVGIAGLNGALQGSYQTSRPSLLNRYAAETNSSNKSVLLGSNGFIQAGGDSYQNNFDLPPDSWTLEAWVQAPSTGIILSRGVGSYAMGFDDNNRLVVYDYPTQLLVSDQRFLSGVHHFVATRNGSVIRLFNNGQLIKRVTTSTPTSVLGRSGYFRLGETGANRFLRSSIDEVAIYTAPLSAARVQAHYQAGAELPDQASGINPLTLAGDQLVFRRAETCYRLMFFADRGTIEVASAPEQSSAAPCPAIAPKRGPNQGGSAAPGDPLYDPVLDNPSSGDFQLNTLSSGVSTLGSLDPPFQYFGSTELAVDSTANSSSTSPIYRQLQTDQITAIQVGLKTTGLSDSNILDAEVPATEFVQKYQLTSCGLVTG